MSLRDGRLSQAERRLRSVSPAINGQRSRLQEQEGSGFFCQVLERGG